MKMNMRAFYRSVMFTILSLPLVMAGCDAAKKASEKIGNMTFSGTVTRAGTTTPIANATVTLIPLVSADAIKQLIEVKKVPDGSGGKKDRVRIKADKVQAYIGGQSGLVTTTSDEQGKFSIQAPINVYFVYTTGPGDAPGTTAAAFGAHFWGINPDTGELDKDHLIGIDGKLTQSNDKIQLSGGPVPPAPPPAAAPQPKLTVTPPAAPATPPPAVATEPQQGDKAPAKGNIVPPARAATFWTSVKLNYDGGFIGTGGANQIDRAPLPAGQRFLEISAELATAQAAPVYLVMQKGIDSTAVSGCSGVLSAATIRVYPVTVNGTNVSYQLVPPGPYYKFYLAQTATLGADGEAPTAVTNASDTITVGKQSCDFATPERPFLATLTWDQQVDVDLYVSKFDAAKLSTATTPEDIGAALLDQANFTRRQGTTLTLDVDNIYGYGPENNGESSAETKPENYCYMVQLNYFAGSASLVNATIDITYVKSENSQKVVRQLPSKTTLTQPGEWKTIGAYGPSACQKLLNPPPSPADVMAYPSASACVSPASCDLKGEASGKYVAKITLDKQTYAAADAVKVTYDSMPDLSGNWITIVPKNNPDNSWCTWQWATGKSGTQYYGSLPAGEYEARLYYNWVGGSGAGGGQCEVIGRQAFTVQ